MWKTLKNATGTSKSLDFSSRHTTPDPQRAPPPTPAAPIEVDPFASHAKFVTRSNSSPNPSSAGSLSLSAPPVVVSAPADGVFASEPQAVPSPSKPPKPMAKQPQFTTASTGLSVPQSQQQQSLYPQHSERSPLMLSTPQQSGLTSSHHQQYHQSQNQQDHHQHQQSTPTVGIEAFSPAPANSHSNPTPAANINRATETTATAPLDQSSNLSISSQKSSGNKQSVSY